MDGSGNSDVKETYENGSGQLKGKFLTRLKMLGSLEKDQWHETLHKQLKKQDGLCELRFKADGVQQRPLGFHMPSNTFVILFWAIEKNNKFIPPGAVQTAKARRLEVEMDGDRADALWLALE